MILDGFHINQRVSELEETFWVNSENFPVPFCSKDPKGLSKIGDLSKPDSSVLAKPGLKFMFSEFIPAFFFQLYMIHYYIRHIIIWKHL